MSKLEKLERLNTDRKGMCKSVVDELKRHVRVMDEDEFRTDHPILLGDDLMFSLGQLDDFVDSEVHQFCTDNDLIDELIMAVEEVNGVIVDSGNFDDPTVLNVDGECAVIDTSGEDCEGIMVHFPGRSEKEFKTEEEAKKHVKELMDKAEYYPNVVDMYDRYGCVKLITEEVK